MATAGAHTGNDPLSTSTVVLSAALIALFAILAHLLGILPSFDWLSTPVARLSRHCEATLACLASRVSCAKETMANHVHVAVHKSRDELLPSLAVLSVPIAAFYLGVAIWAALTPVWIWIRGLAVHVVVRVWKIVCILIVDAVKNWPVMLLWIAVAAGFYASGYLLNLEIQTGKGLTRFPSAAPTPAQEPAPAPAEPAEDATHGDAIIGIESSSEDLGKSEEACGSDSVGEVESQARVHLNAFGIALEGSAPPAADDDTPESPLPPSAPHAVDTVEAAGTQAMDPGASEPSSVVVGSTQPLGETSGSPSSVEAAVQPGPQRRARYISELSAFQRRKKKGKGAQKSYVRRRDAPKKQSRLREYVSYASDSDATPDSIVPPPPSATALGSSSSSAGPSNADVSLVTPSATEHGILPLDVVSQEPSPGIPSASLSLAPPTLPEPVSSPAIVAQAEASDPGPSNLVIPVVLVTPPAAEPASTDELIDKDLYHDIDLQL